MNNIHQLGKQGEELAAEHLLKSNYIIIEKNWRYGHLEVDIIAQNSTVVAFCEVKTRTSSKLGAPESFVTPQKQRNLIKAAHYYMNFKQLSKEVRFDIISILKTGDQFKIEHIEDAFKPKW